jgi:hypothetical protein
MKGNSNKFIRSILFLGLTIVLAILFSTQAHALRMKSQGAAIPQAPAVVDWDIANLPTEDDLPASLPQPPEQDQCLHCHIAGSNENLWTPLARWSLFGVTGLVVVFGITRSAWVWRNKKPWVPLTTRAGNWIDERYKTKEVLEKFLSKPVPNWATRWWYCLGGITAFLFVIQAITGIMLAFYYQPTPENAYASIQYIENEVFFGASIRSIHHWAANGMVVMCIAHMLRVFIMGAFKPPRELNWSSGVILFIVTMGFGFTGYLLPWDQRAYWATTVGTEIAGGIPDIGELILVFLRVGWGISAATLSRFYSLHVLVLPILVIVTMVMHFLMIRRQGLKEPL